MYVQNNIYIYFYILLYPCVCDIYKSSALGKKLECRGTAGVLQYLRPLRFVALVLLGILRGLNCSICIFGQVVKVPGPSDVLRSPDPRKAEVLAAPKNQGVGTRWFVTYRWWKKSCTRLVGSFSHYCIYQGFIHPRWCRISSINSTTMLHTIISSGGFPNIFGIFTRSCLGKWNPIWRSHIFQRGWFNQKLDNFRLRLGWTDSHTKGFARFLRWLKDIGSVNRTIWDIQAQCFLIQWFQRDSASFSSRCY